MNDMSVITSKTFPEVKIITPTIYNDLRGFLFESINNRKHSEIFGKEKDFVQENISYSKKNVIRGIHYQIESPQGKLIRVLKGKILDVVVDLRETSDTFGLHETFVLDDDKHEHLWVPEGFGHGFSVLSDEAIVVYSLTAHTNDSSRVIVYNDPTLNIDWKIDLQTAIVSSKDLVGTLFTYADKFLM